MPGAATHSIVQIDADFVVALEDAAGPRQIRMRGSVFKLFGLAGEVSHRARDRVVAVDSIAELQVVLATWFAIDVAERRRAERVELFVRVAPRNAAGKFR